MTFTALGDVEERLRCCVGVQVCEGIGSELIRPVVEGAAADVGDIDAELDFMLSRGPGDDVGAVEVVFGAAFVGLRSAARECAGDFDLRRVVDAVRLAVVVADQKVQCVDELWRSDVNVADVDLVFEEEGVCAGFGKDVSADAFVAGGRVFVGVSGPELVGLGVVVEDAA